MNNDNFILLTHSNKFKKLKEIKIKKEDLPKERKPIAPPQKAHKDKSKYTRKSKHKEGYEN